MSKNYTYQKSNETEVHFAPTPAQKTNSPAASNNNFSQTSDHFQSSTGYLRNVPETFPSLASTNVAINKRRAQEMAAIRENKEKRNRMQELKQFFKKTSGQICLFLCFALITISSLIAIVLYKTLYLPTHAQFSWLAPEILRHGQHTPNVLQMDIYDQQARFELTGNLPFKSNFISVLDFKTNKIAVIDLSLRVGNRNLVCFLLDLNRQNIPDIKNLQKAAKNSLKQTSQSLGWQEAWTFIPTPIDTSNKLISQFFQPDVAECRGARWIALQNVNNNQKPSKCSECFDFCLPEYGIEKDYIRDETFLNILQRNCFYLFVPEWRNFASSYGNHQNQQEFESFNNHRLEYNQFPKSILNKQDSFPNTVQQIGDSVSNFANQVENSVKQSPILQNIRNDIDSRWTSLKTIPQHISNISNDAYRTVQQNFQLPFNNKNSYVFEQPNAQTQNPYRLNQNLLTQFSNPQFYKNTDQANENFDLYKNSSFNNKNLLNYQNERQQNSMTQPISVPQILQYQQQNKLTENSDLSLNSPFLSQQPNQNNFDKNQNHFDQSNNLKFNYQQRALQPNYLSDQLNNNFNTEKNLQTPPKLSEIFSNNNNRLLTQKNYDQYYLNQQPMTQFGTDLSHKQKQNNNNDFMLSNSNLNAQTNQQFYQP